MSKKIESLQALFNLLKEGGITEDEYQVLKLELIGSKENHVEPNPENLRIKIPDPQFRKFLEEKHGLNFEDGMVQKDLLKKITHLECEFAEITSLKGIEHFESLVHLDCSFNEIDELDISNNRELIEVHVVRNMIDKIDLSRNFKLEVFSANQNELYNLDLSQNPNLTTLFCSNNRLESIVFIEGCLPKQIHLGGNPGEWWKKYQNIKG